MSIITVATDVINGGLSGKTFYKSKTFWANAIALVGLSVQIKYGFVVSPDLQALAMSVINLVLRAITKEPIVFS